ncbi:MAG: sensor histidine kinase [Vicinamibacterales bacterium]
MPRRGRLSWRVILAVGVAYSVFAALVSVWFTWATGRSLWSLQADRTATLPYILAMNVVLWSSWALFAPIAFALGRRFPFDREGWRRALVAHVPAALVVTSAHLVLVGTGRFGLQRLFGVNAEWGPTVVDAFFRTLDFELPAYWALVGLQHATDYYRQARAREVRAARLETRLIEAQLQALQRQLHPHFLFNTLHAISTLVHRDPEKADAMIERLSDLLRVTLSKVGVQEVTLAEEFEYLRAYLDIEQVHFGDRLEIEYGIDVAALDARVPTLVLQPLAENAVRHGLEPHAGRAVLTIEARREGHRLRLRVRDTGKGLAGKPARLDGVGLSNTRARIERLYGAEAGLELREHPAGGVVVDLALPLRVDRPAQRHPAEVA